MSKKAKLILYGILVTFVASLGYASWCLYPHYIRWRREANARDLSQAISSHDMEGIRQHLSKENINSPLIYSIQSWDAPPLFQAASDGNRDLIVYLLDHGADISTKRPTSEDTALHFASDPETAALLIKKGADINAIDLWKRTPLDSAIVNQWSVELINALVTNNANVNSLDNANRTPLDNVIRSEQRLAAIKEILLSLGAKIGEEVMKTRHTNETNKAQPATAHSAPPRQR